MEKEGILLETGTNEVEILELLIGGQLVGINVLKVKQILTYDEKMVTALNAPGTHQALRGTMLFQDEAVLLIDLGLYLYPTAQHQPATTQVVVICAFNNSLQGFLIDGVDRICRLTWDQFQAPSALIASTQALVTGIATIDQREVLMVDFASILNEYAQTD